MLDVLTQPRIRETDLRQCSYMMLTHSNIHHIALNAASQGAVKDWLGYIEMVYDCAQFQTVLTLTDARRSVLPALAYAAHLSSQWQDKSFSRLYSRNAILHRDGPLNPVTEQIIRSLPEYGNHLIRFFAPEDRSVAVRWLISDD